MRILKTLTETGTIRQDGMIPEHLVVFSILPQGTDEKQPENSMMGTSMILYKTREIAGSEGSGDPVGHLPKAKAT